MADVLVDSSSTGKTKDVVREHLEAILNSFEGKPIKAVAVGGPGGGWLPAHSLDVPVDHDSLREHGFGLGSGGIVAVGENTCMVDVACHFLDFAQNECCGQCVPGRLGIRQMFEIVKDITRGRGSPGDIDLLIELAEAVKLGSLCGLGQTAPNPVLSTIRYFREEYEAHVRAKRCPAGVCAGTGARRARVLQSHHKRSA